ncbi:MAG: 16S rRNA (guanine966-N2)-methyltransferase [Verrucomicrobiales bacterium]|jgi:16S rRNA (guanine966-N2)-methyltransferase
MRIVAGTAGGIPIACPKSVTRPTSDRVREALFSILGNRLAGARVLDLYAGSGALGIEALSRGAAATVFVEQQRDACRTIESNLAKARLAGGRVVQSAVEAWLKRRAVSAFDLILADPPYCKNSEDTDYAASLVQSMQLREILTDDGLLVIETQSDQALPEIEHLSPVDSRVYGSTALHFWSAA